MKLMLKDEPREWRKQALLTVLGLALISALLRWRRVLSPEAWLYVLGGLLLVAVCAVVFPGWFRRYYHFSMRAGYWLSLFIGRFLLRVIFVGLVVPMGWALRLAGKDPLQLKRPDKAQTYWQPAKEWGPLDRLF